MSKRKKGWGLFDAGAEEDKVNREKDLAEQQAQKETAEKEMRAREQAKTLKAAEEKEENLRIQREQEKEQRRKELEEQRRIEREEADRVRKEKVEAEKIEKEKERAEKVRLEEQNRREASEKELRAKEEVKAFKIAEEKEENLRIQREQEKEQRRKELEEQRRIEREEADRVRKGKEDAKKIEKAKAKTKVKEERERAEQVRLEEESRGEPSEKAKLKKEEAHSIKKESNRKLAEENRLKNEQKTKLLGDDNKNARSANLDNQESSSNRKWLFLLLILLLSGVGYFISCYVCGYCLKTAISEEEIARYIEVGDTQGNSSQKEATDKIEPQVVKEPTTWYADTDGDGYIDLTDKIESIEQPYNYLDRDNPIDDCPNERGPACTNGCLDNNSNCISDKEEVRSIDSDGDISQSYVPDEKYSDEKPIEPIVLSNDAKEKSRVQEFVPLKVYTWFLDQDNDTKGDSDNMKETNDDNPPVGGSWVQNSDDQCPTRKAFNFEDGCPELQIEMNLKEINVGDQVTLSAVLEGSKTGDKFEWSSSDLRFSALTGKNVEVTSDYVGKFRLVLDVFNATDQFASSATERISFTVSNARLSSELEALAEYGNTGKTGRTKSILDDKTRSLDFIHKSILNKDIPLIKLVQGKKVSYKYSKFENQIMSAKRDASTYVNSINVVDVDYDSNSGKIKGFTFKQL